MFGSRSFHLTRAAGPVESELCIIIVFFGSYFLWRSSAIALPVFIAPLTSLRVKEGVAHPGSCHALYDSGQRRKEVTWSFTACLVATHRDQWEIPRVFLVMAFPFFRII